MNLNEIEEALKVSDDSISIKSLSFYIEELVTIAEGCCSISPYPILMKFI
jgi:hypothetical protein